MMKEILITSSALILALLAIRQGFKGVLSRRVQYALWALVLVRLLVPVSLPATEFSVLTATQPVQTVVAGRVAAPVFVPVAQAPLVQHPTAPDAAPELAIEPAQDRVWVAQSDETAVQYRKLSVEQVLALVWKAGMVLMGGFFLVSNLGFYFRLRKYRREWAGTAHPYGVKQAVYLVPEGVIPSPCLFGRSIYITPAVATDSEKLRHVLSHEATHARHLDPLWALLRCVCLTVYWFDPLVWVAARCSRADCELACDESVLRALGEEERIPYGQTLLSLIPVKKVSNPMIAATTMTAGKKQLKDRVSRIARRPRQVMAAALAVAVLAGVVSACTFTGGKPGSDGKVPVSGPEALTGEELRWFNEEFFSSPEASLYNFRNQFANPLILYDRPEDIDLYELFYCEMGDGEISDAELTAAFGFDTWEDMPCPGYKMTAGEIDRLLVEYTGRSLEETNKVGLDQFTYLEEYDAYYWMHGDTNYSGGPKIAAGVRDGDLVKLYHNSSFAGTSWYCVTLVEAGGSGPRPYGEQGTEERQYYFVSHQECEAPAIPTPLPAGEPKAVIDLDRLEPYAAPTVTTEPHTDDFIDHYDYRLENWNFDGTSVVVYRSSTRPGTVHAAIRQDDGTMNVFFTTQEDNYQNMFFFHDLFGQNGFTITYQGQLSEHAYGTLVDFYTVGADGAPALLCRTQNGFYQPIAVDLNGDGTSELVTEKELFFQREGRVYRADLPQLLGQALPELGYYWDTSSWDKYARCLVVYGSASDEKLGGRECTLLLYFDGEQVLVYQQGPKSATDHVVDGAAEAYGVPDEVVEDAKNYVLQEVIEEGSNGTWFYRDREEDGEAAVVFDDWRIESFTGFYSEQFGDIVIEGWSFNYELHTTTPENVILAGGRYITMDDWVSPGYPGCEWLFYRLSGAANENRALLWHDMINDMSTDSWAFKENVISHLDRLGVDLGGTSVAAEKAAQALELILNHSGGQVRMVLSTPDGVGGGDYLLDPNEGNGPYARNQFTSAYTWSEVEPPAQTPTGASLLLADPNWYSQLQFWQGSDLVLAKGGGFRETWFRAESVEPADDVFYERSRIFPTMRILFDEAELSALRGSPSVKNENQSYLNIAQDWAEAYEGGHLKVTPGSSMGRFTFLRIVGVGTLEDMPDAWFPPESEGHERFAFIYEAAFLPEDEAALAWVMAGNTGNYEGPDPNVPEGAYSYLRRGAMYLNETDNVWVCAGVGTG